jgi:hypothetical protein
MPFVVGDRAAVLMSRMHGDIIGVWRRLLLSRTGEPTDETTIVVWLQGPRFFVDLRQSPDCPAFDNVRCLGDLTPEHVAWLATQEGFAGELYLENGRAFWDRHIDFQPRPALADKASVYFDGDFLHEDGTEADYYEKWKRDSASPYPATALKLECEATKCAGYLLRAGRHFMFARDRLETMPRGNRLSSILRSETSLNKKRALIDFEISLGEFDHQQNMIIERSTLPFRRGRAFELLSESADVIVVADIDEQGLAYKRRWRVLEREESAGTMDDDVARQFAFEP